MFTLVRINNPTTAIHIKERFLYAQKPATNVIKL